MVALKDERVEPKSTPGFSHAVAGSFNGGT
jgi:hypothetical protein